MLQQPEGNNNHNNNINGKNCYNYSGKQTGNVAEVIAKLTRVFLTHIPQVSKGTCNNNNNKNNNNDNNNMKKSCPYYNTVLVSLVILHEGKEIFVVS